MVQPLVSKRLERVSKDLFKRYYKEITEIVGSSPGVYALYDSDELYYVGKSTDLKQRVRHHLVDRHLASWTHFSLYLARKVEHIHEIESLLIRIANPKGNRVRPKGQSSGALLKELQTLVKKSQKDEYEKMFGTKKTRVKKAVAATRRSLVGLVTRTVALYKTYKGKEYAAKLTPKGEIIYKGKTYTSPTAAARAVIHTTRAVNGWWFWYIKADDGEWVRLNDFAAS
jgi:hypothetical protein